MGVPPDSTIFGSQTVIGPCWPNVEEETLSAAAASYEALAAKISGTTVPELQAQLARQQVGWTGLGGTAAAGEATTIIAGHEANAAQALAIATKLRAMEVSVAKTKGLVNATAEEVNTACMQIAGSPDFGQNQALIQSTILAGQSQNIAYVNSGAAEIASSLGMVPNTPSPTTPPGAATAGQAADKGSEQMMQMMMQMAQMGAQLPQQLGSMVSKVPEQLTKPLQQLTQPLQQLMSMGGKGGGGLGSGGPSPFSAFSNHPLAGGSGAGVGGGMTKAASIPGSGGLSSQTPMLATMVGGPEAGVHAASASVGGVGGLAPVNAGGGGMGGGMHGMGQRGESGGTAATLSAPSALEYDLGEEPDDDW